MGLFKNRSVGWPENGGVDQRHRFSVPRTNHDDLITLVHLPPTIERAFPTRAILLRNTLCRELAKNDARL
jgi:hypothetical protein